MKVGMNLFLWSLNITKEHLFAVKLLKDMGYDGVELEVSLMPQEDFELFAKELEARQMEATTLTFVPKDADPRSEDPAEKKAYAESMIKSIDRARMLGSCLLTGPFLKPLGAPFNWLPSDEEKNRIAESLKPVLDYAARYNFKLAPEVCNKYESNVGFTVADMLDVIERTGADNIGIHVDTYHGNIDEADVCEAWRQAGDRIFEVHISENNRGTPGTGHAVPAKVFDTLKEIGYDGWLVIEAFFHDARLRAWYPTAGSREELAENGLRYIRENLNRLGIK